MNAPKLWQFFYEDNNGQKIAVGIKLCIAPQRTKKYKRNLNRLFRPNVRAVGYELL